MKILVATPRFKLFASTINDGNFAVPKATASKKEKEGFADRIKSLCIYSCTRQPRAICVARLVHGNVVVSADRPMSGFEFIDGVDGLVTIEPDVALVVTGADCPPVFIASQLSRCIGLAHSGRAGTLMNISRELVSVMHAKAPNTALDVWIGPGICGDCYHVNKEIIAKFSAYPDAENPRGSECLDLPAVIESQLRASIKIGCFQRIGGCTLEQPELWYSYRRDTLEKQELKRPRVQVFVAMLMSR